MPNRSSKKKQDEKDVNVLAAQIVEAATDDDKPTEKPTKPDQPQKNPAAVELGRLGGKKGGKARAEKLSARQRKEIARKAAQKRWGKESSTK